MEDLIDNVNRALRASGWSAQHASRQVGGSAEFIRNLRRGHVTSITKFRALCEVLGLEFYVGPVRDPAAVDERRLEMAIVMLERALLDSEFVLAPEGKASVVAAIYEFVGAENSAAATARLKRLIAAMAAGRRSPGDEQAS